MQARLRGLVQGGLVFGLILVTTMGVFAQTNTPRLRVMHAAPGAPAADIYVDGNLVFPNIPYQGISNYVPLPAGNRTLRITPAGQSNSPILEPTLPLAEGRDYTVLAVGRPGSIEAWQITDNNALPEAGRARVRLVHAALDAPAIDICLVGQNSCPVTNISYRNTSDYIPLNAGTYNLEVRRSGTNEVLRNLPDLRVNNGAVYSLFLTGLVQGEVPLQLIVRGDVGQGPDGPPNTGAFLSLEAMVVVFGVMAVLSGGFWLVRRRRKA